MDYWDVKESEFTQRHEEILLRREALLRGSETYYDAQDNRSSSFISDYSKAMQRNDRLRDTIRSLDENMRREVEDKNVHREFHTIKENYWAMVRNTFPIWYGEQVKYEQTYGSPRPSFPSVPILPDPERMPNNSFPVPKSPRVGRESPRPRSKSKDESPRPSTSRIPSVRLSQDTLDSQEFPTVPPLELDFSMGEDLTVSQATASKHKQPAVTPKSALASTSAKSLKNNKKVSIKDDAKAQKELKKAQEKAAKAEKERQKKLEKEKKKDSARSKSSGRDSRRDSSAKREPQHQDTSARRGSNAG